MIGWVCMKKTFEVPIIYKGQINYIIEAESQDEAQSIACAKFNNNDKGDIPVVEWGGLTELVKLKKFSSVHIVIPPRAHGLAG